MLSKPLQDSALQTNEILLSKPLPGQAWPGPKDPLPTHAKAPKQQKLMGFVITRWYCPEWLSKCENWWVAGL